MRSALVVVVVSGCAFGAGPLVGYGNKRGAFVGGELGGGLMIAQAAVAAHSTGEVYLRGEATLDVAGVDNTTPRFVPGGRIGGGYAVTGRTGGVFVVGFNVNFLLNREARACTDVKPAALVAIDLRYVGGEWAMVFAPRIEGHTSVCFGN